MTALSTNVTSDEGGTRITVQGRITIDSSPALRDRILAILSPRPPSALTIDLTSVPYMDTSGLATLLEALKVARANKTALRVELHARPRYLLDVTGLLPFFEAAGS
jgi:anti-anti-sigma factor